MAAVEWVWNYSRSRHSSRLVLLAIASRGEVAEIGIDALAGMTRLSDRAVQLAITDLVILGELAVEFRPGATSRYRVLMPEREPLPLPLPTKRDPIPIQTRFFVLNRDGYRCVQCGATEDLTMDHIHPQSLGGPHTEGNLQTLCRSCNSSKGARV